MAILKPNIPLKYVKPDGTTQSEYPLTSIDQVIDEDGIHRLNQTIVRADLSDVEEGQVVLTNADLLENHPASYFATSEGLDTKANKSDVKVLQTKTRINYLRPTLQTQTKNGVTCTNNGDGTFTLNGTATETSYFYFNDLIMDKPFKLVGCPKGGSQASYHILFKNVNSGGWYEDYGNGVIVNINEKTTYNNFSIKIIKGYTADNLVFKPMITDDLSATYDDFVSYDNSLVTGSNQYFFGGIDKDRVLATFRNNGSYTATEDCWAYIYQPNYSSNVHIGGMNFKVHGHGDGTDSIGIFPMKKGMEIWVESSSGVSITVYGIKR